MTTVLGFVAGGLIILSLLALVALAGAAATIASSTLRANCDDAALRDDLDQVLHEILGERSTVRDA